MDYGGGLSAPYLHSGWEMASIKKRVFKNGMVKYDVTVTKRGAPRLFKSCSTMALAKA